MNLRPVASVAFRGMDRSRFASSLALLGPLVLLAAPAPLRAGTEDPDPGDLPARVDACVEPLVRAGLFSGAVLVARGGKVLVEKAWGMADPEAGVPNRPDTRFKIMSVTKSVTAVGVMALVQEGKVALGDPVGKHLAPWPERWRGVTVRHLLDHTSGLPNLEGEWAAEARKGRERGLPVWRRFAPIAAGRSPEAAPGVRHRYANFHYVLLGLVVEAASGRPWAEHLRKAVLGPAGMDRTGVDDGSRRPGLSVGHFLGGGGVPLPGPQDMSEIDAAGGLFSTVGDLHRLDRALRGDTVLSPATRALMLAPSPAGGTYACGWQVDRLLDRDCVHHSGGSNGYVADFLRFPGEDACVVVLSNYAYAPAGRIALDLAGLLFGRECERSARPSPAALAAAAGVYRPAAGRGDRALLLRPCGGTLLLFDVGDGDARCGGRLLVPLAGGAFLHPFDGSRIAFPSAGGEGAQARALTLDPGGRAFARRDPDPAAWRAAAGEWRPTRGGAGVLRIAEEGGRLRLEEPARGARGMEILPVSADAAIVLGMEDLGTPLRLERDPAGKPVRLRWLRLDGTAVEADRAGR